MNKRVIIIHGWEGSPESNWFPWLKSKLEASGFEVQVPEMPNANHPQKDEWVNHLKKIVGDIDESLYIIGHSLGGITVLRFLEQLPENKMINGAIFAAGFPQSVGIDEIENFFDTPVNFSAIKNKAKRFIVFASDNDPYVPHENAKILERELEGELVMVPNGGHLNTDDGFTEFPLLLEKILEKQDLAQK